MSDAGGNGRPGEAAEPSGEHPYGADEARAYVPPQAIKDKPKPADDGGAKVQIRDSVNPRRMKTMPRQAFEGGTLPMQPVPQEVQDHARGMGMTPPQGVPAASAGPLPFRPAEAPAPPPAMQPPAMQPPMVMPPGAVPPGPVAAPPPVAVPPAASPAVHPTPHAPVGPQPKQPPPQLSSPGVLNGPHGAPLTVRRALGLVAETGHASAGGYPPAPHAPAGPPVAQAPMAGAPMAGAPMAGAPMAAPLAGPAIAAGAGAGYGAAGGAPAAEATPVAAPSGAPSDRVGEHPLAATNSPWSQEQKLAAEVLPSANVLAPQEAEPPPPPPPVQEAAATHSRAAMTIGLAIAAIALIAAVVYFTVAESDESDDPANVKVGSEQRDYGDDPEPAPTASAKQTEAPRPVTPRPFPKAPPKPKPAEDIYENIE